MPSPAVSPALAAVPFGDGRVFLRAWQAWRDDAKRPPLLQHIAFLPWPQEAAHWAGITEPGLQPLAQALAAQWWGLTPGLHRLAFEGGRVILSLWVGDEAEAEREMGAPADAPALPLQRQALVIGGGLAGASAAASLARRGWQVQVLDAAPEPAAGASGLPAGLMAPHYSHDDNLLSQLSRHGARQTLQQARALLREGDDWEASGTLEHRVQKRPRPVQAEGALADWRRQADEAQVEAAGLPAQSPAIWHAQGAWIKPAALVRAWLQSPGITWRGGAKVEALERVDGRWVARDAQGLALAEAPLVVLAAALGSGPLSGERLWLQPVRGQVSWGLHTPGLTLPPFPVNGNGHLLTRVPLAEGLAWMSGSSYGRGDTDTREREADHQANLERIEALLPDTARQLAPAFATGQVRGWSGVRCASSDRRPLVGPLDDGLWVSTAMGSRGLTFAALCAELLAARLHGEPLPLPRSLAGALDLARQTGSPPLSENPG